MTRLTDMQLVLLSTAAARDDGSLLPPAESLGSRFDRIRRSVQVLIDKGLASEFVVTGQAQSWREEDGIFYGVMISEAGRVVLDGSEGSNVRPADDQAGAPAVAQPAVPRDTKASRVITLLQRDGGASLAEIMELTGWLPHTSRAALTGLRKKGHAIVTCKVEGVTRYTIGAGG